MSLEDGHRIDAITTEVFAGLLEHYPHVVPARASEYEFRRYTQIPQTIAARKVKDEAQLGKTEVVVLVDWKLAHGTFRPKLKQLVQSNPPDVVEKTTAAAFASFDGSPENVKSSLAELSTLKGIGPATASLLLSVAFPDQVPFFSDELFRWAFWEEGKGKGWDRSIKYTPKEYLELYSKVQEVRNKHGWPAANIEKTAFVLGVRCTEKGRSARASEVTVVGQASDRATILEKMAKKRAGVDIDETTPPPTKKAKQSSASKTPSGDKKEKKPAGTAKAGRVRSTGTRSSSRLKGKAS
ncbi:Putative DNA glycosylase [Septoria linicola]|uniref:DNA glycosylase n=1 Tax=Septoria linicola TaxID=215465 RepID=A0A9Q9B1D4_9PEZI|nr:Putative DNA glycosylase [Septoria linicola]